MKQKDSKKDKRLYNKNFIEALNNAINGIFYSVNTQTNIRKQLILGAMVLILSLFYNFSTVEFLCVVFAIFFVIFAEMINTAIETVVDLYVDVYHPKAKIAKDVAAGAVVLSAINAVIVAYFLFFNETTIIISNSILSAMVSSPKHLAFVAILLTIIVILIIKAQGKKQENKNRLFLPSGRAILAFALLTVIWLNTNSPIIFCLSFALSLLVIGNRITDKKSFGEVLFGICIGTLIVLMVYGLTIFKN